MNILTRSYMDGELAPTHQSFRPPMHSAGRANAVILAVIVAVCAPVASPMAQSSEEMQRFEQHIKRGAELLDAGEYDRSIEELEQARAIVDHPRISFTIARAYEQWGRCARAERAYRALLERDGVRPDRRSAIEERLGGIDECVEKTALEVECKPEGATVTVAGETSSCPVETDLEVGTYEMRVEAEGHETQMREITLRRGKRLRERVVLDAQRAVSSSANWQVYAGWISIGLGGGLFLGGIASDYSSVARASEISEAQRRGRTSQVDSLLAEARRSRTRTIMLYSLGGGLALTGVLLHLLIPDPPDDRARTNSKTASTTLRPRGLGLELIHRW